MMLVVPGLWWGEFRLLAHQADLNAAPIIRFAMPGPVGGIQVQPDGKIVVMGCGFVYFQDAESGTVGEISAAVTRFTPDGQFDLGFAARANLALSSSVFEEHLQARADGRILVTGGFYSREGGLVRSELKMLHPDGSLDKNFAPWCGDTNDFNEIMPRPFSPLPFRLAAFDMEGKVVTPCLLKNPQTSELRAFALDDKGCVIGRRQPDWAKAKFPASLSSSLTEHGFHLFRPVNWSNLKRTAWSTNPPQNRSYYFFCMAGDPPSGGDAAQVLQAIFAEFPIELCHNAVRLPDGGALLLVQEGDTGRFMRFDKSWLPDLSYTNSLRARAYLSLVIQKNGKLLVARGSELLDVAGASPGDVVRVNTDGSIDKSFRCDTDERVMCMALQADGKILIGGFFNTVNGIESPRLARLNPDGSLDRSFPKVSTDMMSVVANRRVPVRSLAATAPERSDRALSQLGTGAAMTRSVLITSFSVSNGIASLRYRGEPSQTYILQACASFDSGAWFNVFTNRTDANGSGNFADATAKEASARFYRVASP
jgi:uncharacterized delta-60 repeat protein